MSYRILSYYRLKSVDESAASANTVVFKGKRYISFITKQRLQNIDEIARAQSDLSSIDVFYTR